MIPKMLPKLAVALMLASAGASHAYPDKPITLVVPFAAGSATDVAARTFAGVLSQSANQAVVIDNRTGAEGTIGARAVLTAAPDGYTLLFTSSSLTVLDSLMKANLPYDPVKDFTPICTVGGTKFLLNITGSSPLKTCADVIAAAKAAPGKLTFGYSSASTRLAAELFQQSAGVNLTGVPYRSSMAGLTEVSAGQVDMFFIDTASAGPFYQSGKLRPLIASGAARLKDQPGVPSAAEAGIPDFNVTPWFGVYLAAKVPSPVAEQVRNTMAEALARPAMKAALEQRQLTPITHCGDAMKTFQKNEIDTWRRVTTRAGITPQ